MKKTTMRRLTAAVAAICMCAMAATPLMSMAASVTVRSQDGNTVTVAGKTFSAYKILDALKIENPTEEGSTEVTYSYNYTVAQGWKSVLIGYTPFGLTSSATDADIVAKIRDLDDTNAEVQAFAQYLAKNIPAVGTDGIKAPVTTGTVAEGSTEVKIDDLDVGYYMVLDTTGNVSGSAVSAVMLQTSDDSATINLKANAPTIDKKIWEDVDADNAVDSGELYEANTAYIGEKVNYYVTSVVPDTTYYTNYHFIMSDTIDAGLTLNRDVKITLVKGTETKDLTAADYTVVYTDAAKTATNTEGDGHEEMMTITFTDMKTLGDTTKETNYAGWQIVVEYSATVNEGANVGEDGNINGIFLTYSNNPVQSGNGTPVDSDGDGTPDDTDDDDDNDGIPDEEDQDTPDDVDTDDSVTETKEEEVVTYLCDFTIKKTDGTGAALDGAYFTLYSKLNTEGTDVDETSKIALKAVTGKANTYTIDEGGSTFDIEADGGTLVIYGLAEGTYYIKETKAPGGYNPISKYITMTTTATVAGSEILNASYEFNGADKCTWEYTVDNNDETLVSNSTDVITVMNKAGSLLPSTGGFGTTLFTVAGITLMVGAAGLYIVKRRVSNR